MDDGFIFWTKHFDFEYFSVCQNNLHPALKNNIDRKRPFPNPATIDFLIDTIKTQTWTIEYILNIVKTILCIILLNVLLFLFLMMKRRGD